MSRIVASGVDFLEGITAAGDELAAGAALGLLFVASGDEDLLGEGEVCGFGVGDEVFSVVTETLGSEVLLSRDAAGDGLAVSSWAAAKGTAAAKRAAIATMVIFICSPVVEVGQRSAPMA